jgi:hypoxanthine-DNA glycosylase
LIFLPHTNYSAFWWIAGDALGFRRASGISPSTHQPFKFTTALQFDNVLPYEQQLELFCSKGFALWDVLKSCQRKGSLDSDIHNDIPNEIDKFCQEHPTIRRIVLANGGSSCVFFKRHFKGWLDSGHVVPGANDASQQALRKWAVSTATATKYTTTPSSSSRKKKSHPQTRNEVETATKPHRIEIISALAVSPAAARYTYEEKRDFWVKHVYAPGLNDHRALQTQQQQQE